MDDLLNAARWHGFPITYDELVECVETNDKRRFAFDDTGEMVRANQGHSDEVDLQLEECVPPETLYHGTVERFLPSILAEAQTRGGGTMSPVEGRGDGTEGRGEAGQAVVLRVDVGMEHRDSRKLFLSANGVWLTDAVLPGLFVICVIRSTRRPRSGSPGSVGSRPATQSTFAGGTQVAGYIGSAS